MSIADHESDHDVTAVCSSDLWVNFPDKVPQTTNSGESLTLSYAIGSAAGGHPVSLSFGQLNRHQAVSSLRKWSFMITL